MRNRLDAIGRVVQIPAEELAADAQREIEREAAKAARISEMGLSDTPSDAPLSQVIADLNAVKARLREA